MDIENRRVRHGTGWEKTVGGIPSPMAFSLPALGELISSGEPLIPQSPITGLPDLQRFPDTFGYPTIWGGSGKDEKTADAPEPEPSRFDALTDEQLCAWTDTWEAYVREFAVSVLFEKPERLNRLIQILRDDQEEIAIEEARDVLDPLRDLKNDEPTPDEWLEKTLEELKEMSPSDPSSQDSSRESSIQRLADAFGLSLPGGATLDDLHDAWDNAPPRNVGADDLVWELEFLTCADEVRRRVVRSFPEHRDLSDAQFQQALETEWEAMRKRREDYDKKVRGE